MSIKASEFLKRTETVCIRCAKCVSVCPLRLYPVFIKEAIDKENRKKAKRLSISNCIECVLCTKACPSGIPLQNIIHQGKQQLLT